MSLFDSVRFAQLAPHWKLEYAEEMVSTSAVAKCAVEAGRVESATVFVADLQSSGVGRRGAQWSSSKGDGLLFTAVLEADLSTSESGKLAIASGLAVADVLGSLGVNAQLKWPNDIYIDGAKVCGILVEQLEGFSLFGIGLNTQMRKFPEHLNATSLAQHCSGEIQHELILAQLLTQIIVRVSCCRQQFHLLQADWQKLDFLLGKQIEYKLSGDSESGVAKGLASNASLLVEVNADLKQVHSAEKIRVLSDTL